MADAAKTLLPILLEPLTEREQEIVAYLAKGLSNHEIARQLHLAEKQSAGTTPRSTAN